MNVTTDANYIEEGYYTEPNLSFWTPLCVRLSVLPFSALLIWHSVKRCSGLNDMNTIERVWKHIRAIRFQPVSFPMLFGIFVNLGLNSILSSLVEDCLMLEFAQSVLSNSYLTWALFACCECISKFLSTDVYRKIGGVNFKQFYLTNLIIDIAAPHLASSFYLLSWMHFRGDGIDWPGIDWPAFVEMQKFIFEDRPMDLLIRTIVSFPFCILAVYRNVTPTAPVTNGPKISILKSMKPKGTLLLSLIVYLIGELGFEMYSRLTSSGFEYGVEAAAFIIFEFPTAACISIHATNQMLSMEVYTWHWVSFLVPAFWKTVLVFIEDIFYDSGYRTPMIFSIKFAFLYFFENGTYGFLSVWVYLKIVERFHARVVSKETALA